MTGQIIIDRAPPAALPAVPVDEAVRVRIGSSPQTDPTVLLSLASDPSVTVRAAVALNRAARVQVDRLLAGDSDERVRTLLARKLASLIPSLPESQRDHIGGETLQTLERLVADEAERVRAAITEVVKDMPGAPRELILRLARDSAVSVCDPVIRLSPILTAEDLMALLTSRPSPVTAIAVARRPNLSESVTDALAATNDSEAVTALLDNQSASIREATLDALIARAGQVTAWHAPLVRRPRLTDRAARALSDIVATQLLDTLACRADLNPAVSGELRRRLAERLQSTTGAHRPEPNMEQAMSEAKILYAEGRLNEEALLAAVQRGEARLASAIVAVATDLPSSVVDRAATLRSAKGLVSLVWRAGFTMRSAGPLQTLLARLPPETVLRGSASGGFPLAVEEMRWQIDFLSRMGR
ncbi:MAG: DUF2336 domain-containing protein [Alphaproteobacteria bacterium]|nr:DUF2336 domain-containing protein [Alphaproteobacteria bacterium]